MEKEVFVETAPAGIVTVMPPSAEVSMPPAAPIILVVAGQAGDPFGIGVPFGVSTVGLSIGDPLRQLANNAIAAKASNIFFLTQQVLVPQRCWRTNVFQRHTDMNWDKQVVNWRFHVIKM